MSLNLNSMIVSMQAHRWSGLHSKNMLTSMQRLSSGLRINSAKDDMAGLAIAQRLFAQAKGFSVAGRNANEGISLSQVTEGGLGKMTDMLQRMRELAVQSANASNSDADRQSLHMQLSQMALEVDRVAKTTSFNGRKLLDGSFQGAVFQVGSNWGDVLTLPTLGAVTGNQLGHVKVSSRTIALDVAQMTDLSAIAAGQLHVQVDSQKLDLGPLAAASSGAERAGQLVAAINSKTADTGMTASLHTSAGGGIGLQLQVQAKAGAGVGGAGSAAAVVGLGGFDAARTGMAALSVARPTNGPGYASYITAMQSALTQVSGGQSTPSLGVAAAQATYADVLAYRSTMLSTYNSRFSGGFSISMALPSVSVSLEVNRAGDGSITGSFTGGLDVAKATAIFGVILTHAEFIQWQSAHVQSLALGFKTGGGVASQNLLNSVLTEFAQGSRNAAAIGNSAIQPLMQWLQSPSMAQLADTVFALPDANLQAFLPSNYTGADMLASLNASLGLSGGQALKAADVFGAQASNWVDTDGAGAITSWKGSDDTQRFNNAAAAWEAAQQYATSQGGLGLRGDKDASTVRGLSNIDISTQQGAWTAIASLDSALESVGAARSATGAWQARLQSVMDVAHIQFENLSLAHSRIVDADFAVEMAGLSRSKILQEASVAMMAQANQIPRFITTLLAGRD